MTEKRFQVISLKTDSDILGGSVEYENVYVSIYPSVVEGEKPLLELELYESSLVEYHLEGKTTKAKILRVQ